MPGGNPETARSPPEREDGKCFLPGPSPGSMDASPEEPGITGLSHVTVYVADAEEALEWYTATLGFVVRADERFDDGRWLTVSPTADSPVEIVLLEPDEDEELVGQGTMWVLTTEDCRATHERLRDRGVSFVSPPEELPWGVSAVFTDLYGNPYNLLEPA